jgi:hypothetical protein
MDFVPSLSQSRRYERGPDLHSSQSVGGPNSAIVCNFHLRRRTNEKYYDIALAAFSSGNLLAVLQVYSNMVAPPLSAWRADLGPPNLSRPIGLEHRAANTRSRYGFRRRLLAPDNLGKLCRRSAKASKAGR